MNAHGFNFRTLARLPYEPWRAWPQQCDFRITARSKLFEERHAFIGQHNVARASRFGPMHSQFAPVEIANLQRIKFAASCPGQQRRMHQIAETRITIGRIDKALGCSSVR